MYALFKNGKKLTGNSYFPIIWNYALSSERAYYRYMGEDNKAEVVLKEGYTIEEVKE